MIDRKLQIFTKKGPCGHVHKQKTIFTKKTKWPKPELHTEGQKFNYIREHVIKSLALANLNI